MNGSIFFKLSFWCVLILPHYNLHSQENFGIEKDLHQFVISNYSQGLVKQFMQRVDHYNNEHENIGFFLEHFSDPQDKRFVAQYLSRIELKRLNRFSYSNGRVKSSYENITLEIGPHDLIDEKILLDGHHYTFPMKTSPRSQLIALKEIIETHERFKASKLNPFQRIFSTLNAVMMQKSFASDAESTGQQLQKMDELVGALLLTLNYVNIHREDNDASLRENLQKLAQEIDQRKKTCQRSLNRLSRHQSQNDAHILANARPLMDFLQEMSDREDSVALDQMKTALESHLSLKYREVDQSQFCRATFDKYYGQTQDEKLRNTCQNLEELRECSIEVVAHNRIYNENLNRERESFANDPEVAPRLPASVHTR